MDNYKQKIKKLLALAESPNEHEAHDALLKARQLMAKHKLREKDFAETEKMQVKIDVIGITCTKRLNAWMVDLSSIIAENYCCKAFRRREKKQQRVEIGFIGFEDDFEICEAVFRYAVDCVLSHCRELRRKYKDIYSGKDISKMCNAYGDGFVCGVDELFERQNEENREWGLVLVLPREIKEACEKIKESSFAEQTVPQNVAELMALRDGYADGQEFDPTHRLNRRQAGCKERRKNDAFSKT